MEADAAARDAESRAAAARALADVAAGLFPLAPNQASAPNQAPTPAEAPEPDQADSPDTAETARPCAAVTISLGAHHAEMAKARVESCSAPYHAEEHTHSTSDEGASVDEDRAESTGRVCAHGSAAEVLEVRVLRRLLTAAADYCTDDRQEFISQTPCSLPPNHEY